jgi:hypothetical protein
MEGAQGCKHLAMVGAPDEATHHRYKRSCTSRSKRISREQKGLTSAHSSAQTGVEHFHAGRRFDASKSLIKWWPNTESNCRHADCPRAFRDDHDSPIDRFHRSGLTPVEQALGH